MSKYTFNLNQRHAVYKVNDGRCQWCGKPLAYLDFHVDHILPEDLLNDNANLQKVKETYGLNNEFNINDYENWIPAHPNCNQRKSDKAYEGLPFLKTLLDKSAKLKPAAKEVEEDLKKQPKKGKLLIALQHALEAEILKEDDITAILNKRMEKFDELSEDNLEVVRKLIEDGEEYQKKKQVTLYMQSISTATNEAMDQLKNELGEDWSTGSIIRLGGAKDPKDSEYNFRKLIKNKYDQKHGYELTITPFIEAGNVVAKLRIDNEVGAQYETFYIQEMSEPLAKDNYKTELEKAIRAKIAKNARK